MTLYKPGLHIVATLRSSEKQLTDITSCKKLFTETINGLHLNQIGEVYHQFDNGGFTAVICLTESHASIHTWPEHGLATFDVFLSNFNQDNTEKAKAFYSQVLAFFGGEEVDKKEVKR